MAFEMLFGNRITPACQYCREGYPTGKSGEFLCARKGTVAPGFRCRHFYYDPLSRVPQRPLPLAKYDEKSFQLD